MSEQEPWVKETRFGEWFQSTEIWNEYVLTEALETLIRLLSTAPERSTSHPDVLDVGCGIGTAFAFTAQHLHPYRIVGVDIDSQMVQGAKEHAAEISCRVEVRCQNVEKLLIPSESFDIVLCHQTLHHVNDANAAVHEFHRVLKPGGWLLLAESCRRFLRSLPVRLLFRHPKGAYKTAEDYLEVLKSVGFEFTGKQIETGTPFWSQGDFGLCELLGVKAPAESEPTQINVIARRPQQ